MKLKNRIFILLMALVVLFPGSVIPAVSALNARDSAGTGAEDYIERGLEWEALNELYYRAKGLLDSVGNDFTGYYERTLRGAYSAAEALLDTPDSSVGDIKQMQNDLSFLLSEARNPANHARAGYYTVAFTNNGGWSEPVHIYIWDAEENPEFPCPGQAMMSGCVNEYGERQYYAFVPENMPNIVFSSSCLEASGSDAAVPCVEVQTVDITVTGNTGYYLSGERDGAKYKVSSWELKAPLYKDYGAPAPPEPTEEPTEDPTEAPTAEPTQPPTEAATSAPTAPSPTESPTIPPVEPTDGEYLSVDYIIGDADGDGRVTVLDATAIQRYLAGFSSGYLIGEKHTG